ncbi:excalibur calcium-binding domain-containing protein [Glycomyces sp. NRRL B-16210]|uniref:excalibur calcium-binding domain-containing protein n=1 Tax=Glycomyces sp. NRRL B-16210 TaxID=1463821 RepID=UPI00068DD0A1|nr:excalibur calcium-binding domain-containing protein [Glycomyces sp. NRRL B-16210]
MTTDPLNTDPKQAIAKAWSRLTNLGKTLAISVLAGLVLCCGGVINAMGGDDDPEAPVEVATEVETSERVTSSPSKSAPTTRPAPTEAASTTEPEPEPTTEAAARVEETTKSQEVYYENCAAARAAGAAPVLEGQPGYRPGLDGDGDGVGCEDSSSGGGGNGGGGNGGGGGDSGGSGDSSDVHYKNCDAARAAGAAPVYRGDPGYGKHLDRDGDGVGCE